MRINITYIGTINTANERRDFMLMLKYALEANGHDVLLSFNGIDGGRLNIIIGAHNITKQLLHMLQTITYAVINTETIADGMLNYKPNKGAGDFQTFISLLHGAEFIWDVIPQNLEQYPQYGLSAHFLRWGYVPELEEIKHDKPKELDYYYFGIMSDYSWQTIKELDKAGFKGVVHTGVPYYVRNTYIERAKVCLNLIKEPRFRHVNNFRICYLANNRICTLAETVADICDDAKYLHFAYKSSRDHMPKALEFLLSGYTERYPDYAYEHAESFKMNKAKDMLGELMDKSL